MNRHAVTNRFQAPAAAALLASLLLPLRMKPRPPRRTPSLRQSSSPRKQFWKDRTGIRS